MSRYSRPAPGPSTNPFQPQPFAAPYVAPVGRPQSVLGPPNPSTSPAPPQPQAHYTNPVSTYLPPQPNWDSYPAAESKPWQSSSAGQVNPVQAPPTQNPWNPADPANGVSLAAYEGEAKILTAEASKDSQYHPYEHVQPQQQQGKEQYGHPPWEGIQEEVPDESPYQIWVPERPAVPTATSYGNPPATQGQQQQQQQQPPRPYGRGDDVTGAPDPQSASRPQWKTGFAPHQIGNPVTGGYTSSMKTDPPPVVPQQQQHQYYSPPPGDPVGYVVPQQPSQAPLPVPQEQKLPSLPYPFRNSQPQYYGTAAQPPATYAEQKPAPSDRYASLRELNVGENGGWYTQEQTTGTKEEEKSGSSSGYYG
jgi:hypothetical protein